MRAAGPEIRRLGFAETSIAAATGQTFAPHPLGPPSREAAGTGFALFHGSLGGRTPPAPGLWEVAFVGRHAVAMRHGGGLGIPRAGVVLRLTSEGEAAAVAAGPLTYALPGLSEGVQSGPLIVADGAPTAASRDVFTEEYMSAAAPRPDAVPISPHAWAADWHETRAARLSAGLTRAGHLFFCAVEGTSSFFRGGPAKGATLHDLASLMIAEGATTALHLDGGASAQVFAEGGGALITARDVHHRDPASPGQVDRPLPLGLILS
ncbi:MAG: phosphodiester glycosidase family protein [Pseudomonadota bacterium]